MNRRQFAATGLAVLLASSAACSAASPRSPISPVGPGATSVAAPPGAPCPATGGPATSGQTAAFGSLTLPCLRAGPAVRLDTLGGRRPVLVNLWASWCLPCQREMPRLQHLAATTSGRLLVLGVDTEDTADSARSFLRAVGATYPQVVDSNGNLRIHLHAVGLPDTIVIDAAGRVVFRKLGELSDADIQHAVAAAGQAR